jgi:hypothetical protein
LPVFGTRRQVLYFGVVSQKLLNAGLLNLAVFLPIDFVSYQDKREFFWFFRRTLVQKLSYPGFDVVERLRKFSVTLLLVMS